MTSEDDRAERVRINRARQRRALKILRAADGWIGGAELAARVGLAGDTRALRRNVIAPLRFRCRVPVHFRPGLGYKLNVTAGEHRECLGLCESMGRDFFALLSVLRRESVDVVFGQMVMDFLPHTDPDAAPSDDDALTSIIDHQARAGRRVTWIDVVKRLLATMAADPAAYAPEIAELGTRFGGVFLSADTRAAAAEHLRQAQALIGGAPLAAGRT